MGLDLDQNSLQDDRSKKSPSNVDLLSQVEGTSMKKDYIMSINKLFSSSSVPQAAAKSLPFHTLRCHVLYLLSKGRAANTIEFMKKYLTDFYDSCRPSVKSAIFSIQFIAYLKSKEHLQAISLIQKSELKWEPFPSVDVSGKPILCHAEDLTRLFCKSSLDANADNDCHLASQAHVDAVCSFVNKELL